MIYLYNMPCFDIIRMIIVRSEFAVLSVIYLYGVKV